MGRGVEGPKLVGEDVTRNMGSVHVAHWWDSSGPGPNNGRRSANDEHQYDSELRLKSMVHRLRCNCANKIPGNNTTPLTCKQAPLGGTPLPEQTNQMLNTCML